ncbi:MAG: winged helix-turn-helix transcriptional regulator [Parvularculaceae bacterium]
MQRSYNQECSVAYALDLLGERWTLLIVRQLLLGPQRFAELLGALSGIGPNLLTKRLRKLEEARLIRKTEEGDRFSRYQLTPHGERIRPVLRELVRWSVGLLYTNEDPPPNRPQPPATDEILCDTFMLLIEAFARSEHLGDRDFICRFDVEDKEYTVFFTDGRLTTRRGALAPASASVKTDRATARLILERRLSVEDALQQGRVREEGDPALLGRINRALLAGGDRHSVQNDAVA